MPRRNAVAMIGETIILLAVLEWVSIIACSLLALRGVFYLAIGGSPNFGLFTVVFSLMLVVAARSCAGAFRECRPAIERRVAKRLEASERDGVGT